MNPLDSDLSGGQRYPAFEQLGPGSFINIRHILTGFHNDPMVFLIKTTLSEALVGRLSHVKHQLDSRKRNDFLKLCLLNGNDQTFLNHARLNFTIKAAFHVSQS